MRMQSGAALAGKSSPTRSGMESEQQAVSSTQHMGIIDIDRLLAEVSPDAPCGEDLEYDPAFAELQRSVRGKPEQQMGDTLVPAEAPDWRNAVKQKQTYEKE